jgi:cyclopropane fatty-acyl-phospholipid synthase-like methyltransferase
MRRNKVYTYYNEHAKSCAPDDFWGQVKRSINGQVVDQAQIDMIVAAIVDGLDLQRDDRVLDLCCGNGVLSDLIFERCAGGTGVDFAEYLIGVAKEHFQALPDRRYELADVNEFLRDAPECARYTKVLCYSSFQYFSPEDARELLTALRRRFVNAGAVFLGNMPDKARVKSFYYEDAYVPGIEDDYQSPIGLWRTETEFAALAASTGWRAAFRRMPQSFYAAHYRFDAVLTPAEAA